MAFHEESNSLYLFGGRETWVHMSAVKHLNDMWRFSLDTLIWERVVAANQQVFDIPRRQFYSHFV